MGLYLKTSLCVLCGLFGLQSFAFIQDHPVFLSLPSCQRMGFHAILSYSNQPPFPMPEYQAIARRFRPQRFQDVTGQDPIVTTLKNAISSRRLAHAYLFSGPKGTGKTTLARIFAKSLNCPHRTADGEPCNQCPSCTEIALSASLDVLEIDGASHRGIEDIRQINETVGYAASGGGYKIYLIDEVHMLTKEAFNALLKTLEEPPQKVKFLFATTEPHKIPSTILSRCQRFALKRIPLGLIVEKLKKITSVLEVEVDETVFPLIAQRAEGGLRDAESLLDQLLAFASGCITATSFHEMMGTVSTALYFEIDREGKAGNMGFAYLLVDRLFQEGKDLSLFLEGLIHHLRRIILIQLLGVDSPLLSLTKEEQPLYASAALLYRKDQCFYLIEELLKGQLEMRSSPFPKLVLETLLLKVFESHFRLSVEMLVEYVHQLQAQPHVQPTPPRQEIATLPSPLPPSISCAPPLPKESSLPAAPVKSYRTETLLQFAAVELQGRLEKHSIS